MTKRKAMTTKATRPSRRAKIPPAAAPAVAEAVHGGALAVRQDECAGTLDADTLRRAGVRIMPKRVAGPKLPPSEGQRKTADELKAIADAYWRAMEAEDLCKLGALAVEYGHGGAYHAANVYGIRVGARLDGALLELIGHAADLSCGMFIPDAGSRWADESFRADWALWFIRDFHRLWPSVLGVISDKERDTAAIRPRLVRAFERVKDKVLQGFPDRTDAALVRAALARLLNDACEGVREDPPASHWTRDELEGWGLLEGRQSTATHLAGTAARMEIAAARIEGAASQTESAAVRIEKMRAKKGEGSGRRAKGATGVRHWTLTEKQKVFVWRKVYALETREGSPNRDCFEDGCTDDGKPLPPTIKTLSAFVGCLNSASKHQYARKKWSDEAKIEAQRRAQGQFRRRK
jgi:hypothetical protein